MGQGIFGGPSVLGLGADMQAVWTGAKPIATRAVEAGMAPILGASLSRTQRIMIWTRAHPIPVVLGLGALGYVAYTLTKRRRTA